MQLLLWRHAHAVDGLPDNQRELSEKGHKQAIRVANWLNKNQPVHLNVLVSPLCRTQQTAKYLKQDFITSNSLSTSSNLNTLLETIHWPHESTENYLLVGHQPLLGALAAHLLESKQSSLMVDKGALWWFRINFYDQVPSVQLRTIISPKFI